MIRARSFAAAVPATVFEASLRQHEVRTFEDARISVVVSAMGPPRLWGRSLDAALTGFARGLARPHDGTMSSRLHQGLEGARSLLKERTSMLIERRTADVSLVALGLDGHLLHVVCVGPSRAFVRRAKKLRRLSPREDRAEGLLRATPAFCAETLLASDVILCGSLTACSEAALSAVHERMQSDPGASPESLVKLLNEHAAARGLGAAAIVLSIEDARPVI